MRARKRYKSSKLQATTTLRVEAKGKVGDVLILTIIPIPLWYCRAEADVSQAAMAPSPKTEDRFVIDGHSLPLTPGMVLL